MRRARAAHSRFSRPRGERKTMDHASASKDIMRPPSRRAASLSNMAVHWARDSPPPPSAEAHSLHRRRGLAHWNKSFYRMKACSLRGPDDTPVQWRADQTHGRRDVRSTAAKQHHVKPTSSRNSSSTDHEVKQSRHRTRCLCAKRVASQVMCMGLGGRCLGARALKFGVRHPAAFDCCWLALSSQSALTRASRHDVSSSRRRRAAEW